MTPYLTSNLTSNPASFNQPIDQFKLLCDNNSINTPSISVNTFMVLRYMLFPGSSTFLKNL